MTADDVIFSMQEHGREGSLNAFAAAVQRTWGAEGGSVSAPDPYTVVVDTGTFQFDMLEVVSQTGQQIFSKKQVEELGVEAASPIGANKLPDLSRNQVKRWAVGPSATRAAACGHSVSCPGR